MTSVFKKTVLTFAMLGCAFCAQAEKKAASSGAVALASLAMVPALPLTVAGVAGIAANFATAEANNALSMNLLSNTQHGWALLPGLLLTCGVPLYLLKSAKGSIAKLRTMIGSSATLLGGLALIGSISLILYLHDLRHVAVSQSTEKMVDALAWLQGIDAQKLAESKQLIDNTYYGTLGVLGVVAGLGGLTSFVGYAIQPVDNSSEESKA